MFKEIAKKMIRFYQKNLSFDHGKLSSLMPEGQKICKYKPTCSEYGYQAIDKYGCLRGGLMTLWRILRCNPFSKGGDDPVK